MRGKLLRHSENHNGCRITETSVLILKSVLQKKEKGLSFDF